jgi:glutaconyl-CoA/methylmalonyl-CoA decarboxylase subunit gamma
MKMFRIVVNGNEYEVGVEELGEKNEMAPVKEQVNKTLKIPSAPKHQPNGVRPQSTAVSIPEGADVVVAPMPGTISQVNVSGGEKVIKGQTLMILEAMKMENEILAPRNCLVTEIRTEKGASVNAGDILVVLS